MEHLTERPAELKQEIFRLLFDSAEITNFTPEEKAKYQQDMTTERDIRNYITYAREEGKEEGLAKGRAEGKAEGKAEGREETLRIVAEKLRKRGLSDKEIQQMLQEA